jgi:hypothetical protein
MASKAKFSDDFNEEEGIPQVNFTEEWLNVRDLDVDRLIQRDKLDTGKVERIYRNFNPGALGVITVSQRNPVTYIVLDGMHRTEVVRRRTDNAGKILAHVFRDLTRAEEAGMFLDLNYGNQPSLLTKFRVQIIQGDPVAVGIDKIIHQYGWKVDPSAGDGNIQAVGALRKIHTRSLHHEADPPYLQLTMLAITHAWGMGTSGVHGSILEGVAAIMEQYRDDLDLDLLQRVMAAYPGGPMGLRTDARQLAEMGRGRVAMTVGEQLVEAYNKRARSSSKRLAAWRKK